MLIVQKAEQKGLVVEGFILDYYYFYMKFYSSVPSGYFYLVTFVSPN